LDLLFSWRFIYWGALKKIPKVVLITISSLPQTTYNRALRLSLATREIFCRPDYCELPRSPSASRSSQAQLRHCAACEPAEDHFFGGWGAHRMAR